MYNKTAVEMSGEPFLDIRAAVIHDYIATEVVAANAIWGEGGC